MNSKVLKDRLLDLRGYLQFEFPIVETSIEDVIFDLDFSKTTKQSKVVNTFGYNKSGLYDNNTGTVSVGSSDTIIKYRLPFYENIEIRESKITNFINMPILGRNTPFKLFSSGESRLFNVTFYVTLPNLYHYIRSEKNKLSASNTTINFYNRERLKRKFFPKDESDELGLEALQRDIETAENAYRNTVKPQRDPNWLVSFLDSALTFVSGEEKPKTSVTKTVIKAIYLLWVNMIRVSNTTSAEDPQQGAPIIRLNYGEMYKGIPTICTEYSITPIEAAGYDIETLLPNRVQVSMNLAEVRIGNFGTFSNKIKNKDNEYGWDSVLQHGRIDNAKIGTKYQ